ncbi:hypothetical protein ACFFRR_006374 [Megaselia abdita]
MVKVAIVLLVIVGVALCAPEAPLRRSKLTREFGRQQIAIANAVDNDQPEVAVTNEEEEQPKLAKSAPYPAAGFRPERAFNLPTEEADEFNPEPKAEEPAQEYGAPAQEYGPPAQEYGPPTTDDDFPVEDEEPLNDAPEDNEEVIPEAERLTLDNGFLRPKFNVRSEKLQAIRAPKPAPQPFVAQPLYYNPGNAFVYTSQYQSW